MRWRRVHRLHLEHFAAWRKIGYGNAAHGNVILSWLDFAMPSASVPA
jgi:hypothetical protein